MDSLDHELVLGIDLVEESEGFGRPACEYSLSRQVGVNLRRDRKAEAHYRTASTPRGCSDRYHMWSGASTYMWLGNTVGMNDV